MSETTQAASSPAEVDVFNGETPTLAEYNQYRESGEVPERFKQAEPADPAPADDQEETESEGESPEPAPESDPEENQEQVSPKTAKRIKQLLAERHELQQKLAEKEGAKKDSPPAEPPKYAHPKPTVDDKNPDGTQKYANYEEFVEALGRWSAKEERVTWEREYAEKEALKALQTKLDEARSRYDDADDIIFPANKAITEAKIPAVVKEVIAGSDVFTDLLYVVGSDPDALEEFISLAQKNPRAAVGKVFEYERGIKEELAKGSAPRDDKGQFAPARKTSAPKPPSPVSGVSAKAFDVSDDSLSPEEWMRKRNKQLGIG